MLNLPIVKILSQELLETRISARNNRSSVQSTQSTNPLFFGRADGKWDAMRMLNLPIAKNLSQELLEILAD